jgi:hypothetical protein
VCVCVCVCVCVRGVIVQNIKSCSSLVYVCNTRYGCKCVSVCGVCFEALVICCVIDVLSICVNLVYSYRPYAICCTDLVDTICNTIFLAINPV